MLDSFVVSKCIHCNIECHLEDPLCSDCMESFIKLKWSCLSCGNTLNRLSLPNISEITEDPKIEYCANCNDLSLGKKSFQQLDLDYSYHSAVRSLLKGLKFNYIFPGTKLLLSHVEIRKAWESLDIITYVPTHYLRHFTRYRHPTYSIAKHISKTTKVPLQKLMVRKSAGQPQARLTKGGRIKNVENSFEISRRVDQNSLKGKRILLVDDIYTSGATMYEVSRVLKNSGVKDIYAYCFSG